MKGNWTAVNDNSKAGYHFHCIKCNEDKPFIRGAILTCSCDKDPTPASLPSCKKVSTGSCKACVSPCCKEQK